MKKQLRRLLSITLVIIMIMLPQVGAIAATITIKGTTKTVDAIDCTPAEEVLNYESFDSFKGYQFELANDTKEVVLPIHIKSKGVTYFVLYNHTLDKAVQSLEDDFLNYMDSIEEDDYEGLYDSYDFNDYINLIKTMYKGVPQNNMNFKLYSDSACTDANLVADDLGVPFLGFYVTSLKVSKAGTYYLKVSMKDYAGQEKLLYDLYTAAFSGEDSTLKNGGECYVSAINDEPIYFKVTANKDGYFDTLFSAESSSSLKEAKLTLCDFNKKAISNTVKLKDFDETIFAVKKGVYYIALSTSSVKKDSPILYHVSSTFTSVNKKSGPKKSAAVPIALGKNIKGIQTIGDNIEDWYKVKTNKEKKISIKLEQYMNSGNMKVYLYNKNNKQISCKKIKKGYTIRYTSKSKLKSGTYYIKVVKDKEVSSGFYYLLAK